MLELRNCCENCNKDLPAHSKEARICSFECTFCMDCVENLLQEVCPNCGGNFQPRPIRPATNLKNNNDLLTYPARKDPVYKPVDLEAHRLLIEKLRSGGHIQH